MIQNTLEVSFSMRLASSANLVSVNENDDSKDDYMWDDAGNIFESAEI